METMRVITMTRFDDKLILSRSGIKASDELVNHESLGSHGQTSSVIWWISSSKTHNTLVCIKQPNRLCSEHIDSSSNHCNLRIPVPKSVQTYGQLQGYLEKEIKKARLLDEFLELCVKRGLSLEEVLNVAQSD